MGSLTQPPEKPIKQAPIAEWSEATPYKFGDKVQYESGITWVPDTSAYKPPLFFIVMIWFGAGVVWGMVISHMVPS